jgi:hypothetical protein
MTGLLHMYLAGINFIPSGSESLLSFFFVVIIKVFVAERERKLGTFIFVSKKVLQYLDT